MAEGRRDQSDPWRARYVELLGRAARHEGRIERTRARGIDWIMTRRMKPRPPALRIVRGGSDDQ